LRVAIRGREMSLCPSPTHDLDLDSVTFLHQLNKISRSPIKARENDRF
jgi:hypothetical protein